MVTDAERMCAELGGPMHDQAVELAENVLFMAAKLEETRREMEDQPPIVEYNNGGGQCGTRENPIYKTYVMLNRQYVNALRQLNDMLGVRIAPDEDSDDDPLAAIVEKYRNGD